jgi:hypothetical protein
MTVRNRVELKFYIRFQLSQLSARNAEHEFENLAFEVARLRVVPNLLPATGPVQAGGDQGRDFETYRTYLTQSQLGTSAFATVATGTIVVGACTLDKQIVQKIKRDLRLIFGGGTRPSLVAYFCEQDLPVAKRHSLQDYCRKEYAAELEIFDGQALAELLADRDTFWIAEQFLSIPAAAWPQEPVDASYAAMRTKWVDANTTPQNYADFLDIKQGLRIATREEGAKPDLLGWLNVMHKFLDVTVPDRLLQKARYEIAVAELRGRGSLDPALPLVTALFDNLSLDQTPAELLDAAVLAVYASGALVHAQTTVPLTTVKGWVEKTTLIVDEVLANTRRHGDRCLLLDARAMLGNVPHADLSMEARQTRFFDRWSDVVQEIKETPYYPVTHVADILEMVTPIFGTDPRFRTLADDVDQLVSDRAGKGVAADHARKRAIAHLNAGRHVSAIDELQRTKIGWFTGEALEGSILAMLVISQSFEELNLHYAARYYAAAAFWAALNLEGEEVKRRLGQAAFRVADTFHSAGEGITFLYSIAQALIAHDAVATDPHDWTKHRAVQRSVVHAVILRAVARRLSPDYLPLIDRAIEKWGMSKEEVEQLSSLSESEPWATMPVSEIEDKIAEQLGQNPFSDVGSPRSATWAAFGVTWTVQSTADHDSWLAALELAATLQITQVDFADTDLLVIPSHVFLNVQAATVDKPEISQLPDNGRLVWQVKMPKQYRHGATFDEIAMHVASIAIVILGQATALTFEAFQDLIESRFRRGLAHRLASVRPARELMEFAQPEGLDFSTLSAMPKLSLGRQIKPIEAEELRWRTGHGPGYSRARADEYLRNRYERTLSGLSVTLPKLLRDSRSRRVIAKLKAEGLLDWQILSVLLNVVVQYQTHQIIGEDAAHPKFQKAMLERVHREEREEDPAFDLAYLTDEIIEMQRSVSSAAAFKTWDLAVNRQTPDFVAMKRLLDERFGHSSDDIPHDDPFQGIETLRDHAGDP